MDSSIKKLDALLDYIIRHNTEHAEEIGALAQEALALGYPEVHDELTKGVAQMHSSTEALRNALNNLRQN